MLNPNEIQHLDDYQLYQLIHNKDIDAHTRTQLQAELNTRNLSESEKRRLQNKYHLNHSAFNSEIKKSSWNPIFTAFALNYHFRQLAVLKTHGKKTEAKVYMTKLYIGLLFYFFVLILFIFLQRSV